MNIHRILIVDDSDFDRSLLAKVLQKKGGLETLEASSGESCLGVLSTNKIDLVLMDIMMPGMSGVEVLQKIRQQHSAFDLPVIMVTAKQDSADIVDCLQTGANDYISKPINLEVAFVRLQTHLNLAALSKKMGQLREIAGLQAMIATYNHEINNPLTIALGNLQKLLTHKSDDMALKRAEQALWRISDIIRKIKEVMDRHEVEFEPYATTGRMVKLR